MYSKPCEKQILHCGYYMVIFGLAILAKHCQFGQAKPGLPQFADDSPTQDSDAANIAIANDKEAQAFTAIADDIEEAW